MPVRQFSKAVSWDLFTVDPRVDRWTSKIFPSTSPPVVPSVGVRIVGSLSATCDTTGEVNFLTI